jgi:hypothetical protein
MVPANTHAQQQTAKRASSSTSLPDAPLPKSEPQNSGQQTLHDEGSASVAGTVLDVSGATVLEIGDIADLLQTQIDFF